MGSEQKTWQRNVATEMVKSRRIPLENAVAGVVEILAYWQERCPQDGVPRKSDMHPWDLKAKLGRLCILEVETAPLDFVYRLDGSNIASVTQQDMTGQSVLTVTPEEYAQSVFNNLVEALEAGVPALWHVDLNIPPAVYPYQRIILPLTSGNEGKITHLLTYSHCLNSRDGSFPWFKTYGKPD